MTLLRRFLGGLKALFHRDQRNAEMDEELSGYLDAAAQDKNAQRHEPRRRHARGASSRWAAAESVKQKVRASGWESAAEFLWQDVRYGMRQLLRNPGFSCCRAAYAGAGHRRQHCHLHAGACGDAEAVADCASADALSRRRRGILLLLMGRSGRFMGHLRLSVLQTPARYQSIFRTDRCLLRQYAYFQRSPRKFSAGRAGYERRIRFRQLLLHAGASACPGSPAQSVR